MTCPYLGTVFSEKVCSIPVMVGKQMKLADVRVALSRASRGLQLFAGLPRRVWYAQTVLVSKVNLSQPDVSIVPSAA